MEHAEAPSRLRVSRLELDRLLQRAFGGAHRPRALAAIAAMSNSGSTASGLRSWAIWAIDAAGGSAP